MVALKTPVPKGLSQADFVNIEAYVRYLEVQLEYAKMKEEMDKFREAQSNVNREEGGQEDHDAVVEEGPVERDEDRAGGRGDEEAGVKEFRLIKGAEKAKNPGKLVIGESQRFTFQTTKKVQGKMRHHYACVKKFERRGKYEEQCKAKAIVETDEDGENPTMIKSSNLDDHNHDVRKCEVVAWDIFEDMEAMIIGDYSLLPSVVVKRVMLKYQTMFRNDPDLWADIQSSLPSDESMSKRVRRVRSQRFGKVPKNREELDLKSLMDRLKAEGGENVVILDSNDMWENEDFKKEFEEDELFQDDEKPKRAVLFTTSGLLNQLAASSKWSQVIKDLLRYIYLSWEHLKSRKCIIVFLKRKNKLFFARTALTGSVQGNSNNSS